VDGKRGNAVGDAPEGVEITGSVCTNIMEGAAFQIPNPNKWADCSAAVPSDRLSGFVASVKLRSQQSVGEFPRWHSPRTLSRALNSGTNQVPTEPTLKIRIM